MTKSTAEKRREVRQAAAMLAKELAVLATESTSQLAERLEILTGQKPRTRNRTHLRKRVGWLVQAAALGGLSDAAVAKIEELAPLAEAVWKKGTTAAKRSRRGADPAVVGQQRDPRLPAPGTVLRRLYRGIDYEIKVLEDGGFECAGERFGSLSAVARKISGTAWSGLVFFGLRKRGEKTSTQERAA